MRREIRLEANLTGHKIRRSCGEEKRGRKGEERGGEGGCIKKQVGQHVVRRSHWEFLHLRSEVHSLFCRFVVRLMVVLIASPQINWTVTGLSHILDWSVRGGRRVVAVRCLNASVLQLYCLLWR